MIKKAFMSFCTNCGKQNPDTAKFCTSCGTTLTAKVVSSQPNAPIVAPPTIAPVYQPPGTKLTGKNTWIIIAVMLLLGLGAAGYYLFFYKKQSSASSSQNIADSISASTHGLYPQASQRLLLTEELQNMSEYDIKIMRNEIYARHGMIFTNNELNDYFNKQPWYERKYANVAGSLSDIEEKNVMVLKQYHNVNNPSTLNENKKLVFQSPCYVIVTGAYVTENDARNGVSQTIAEGYSNAGYLWIPDYPSLSGKQFFSTFLGPYPTYDECKVSLNSIRQTGKSWYGVKVSYENTRVEIH